MNLVGRELIFKLVFIDSECHLGKVVRNLLGCLDHNVPILSEDIADKLVVNGDVLH